MNWSIEKIHLPLKFDWKISRNSSASKTNLVIKVQEDEYSAIGEVAFNVRYGESLEIVMDGFERFRAADHVSGAQELHFLMRELNLAKSLRFGIESAWLSLQAQKKEEPLWKFLGVDKPAPVKTSFSLPILEPGQVSEFLEQWDLKRFAFLKVKVNQDAEAIVREVAKNFSGPMRIDANEAWSTAPEVIRFIESISDLNVQFIEQPLPAEEDDELLYLKRNSRVRLIGDESITDQGVEIFHRDRFDGVNIKLMKAGGLLPALQQLKTARELGLETMLGCMVETSLGISSALQISAGVDYIDLDGSLLLEEDPFSFIEETNGVLRLI